MCIASGVSTTSFTFAASRSHLGIAKPSVLFSVQSVAKDVPVIPDVIGLLGGQSVPNVRNAAPLQGDKAYGFAQCGVVDHVAGSNSPGGRSTFAFQSEYSSV